MIEPGREGYEPLTPKTSGIIGGRLWIGEGHVLSVEDHFFFQRYRRFFFEDIQAVWVQRAPGAALWGTFWVVCTLPFLVLTISLSGSGRLVFGIAAAFCLAMLLVNHQGGPSCAVFIQTAVQTRKIPALNRKRRAEDVLENLRPWIQMAQEDIASAGARGGGGFSVGESASKTMEEAGNGRTPLS